MPAATPRARAPDLEVRTIDGGTWRLSEQRPGSFTLVVFYRGLHCPICRDYLRDLERRLGDFGERGVEVIAVSGDDRERAERTPGEWGLETLRVGYGQSIANMRAWGLFISNSIRDSEPAQFGEPGLFLVRRGGELYYAAINSAPFARPSLAEVMRAVDYVLENDYPARGEA
jgi:peroxiredoxin